MGTILAKEQSDYIKKIRADIRKLDIDGWMCESTEWEAGGRYKPCHIFFNNDKDISFIADYNGNVLSDRTDGGITEDLKEYARLEGEIRQVAEGIKEAPKHEPVYYGFTQLSHGADHVFIFTKEQIEEENPEILPYMPTKEDEDTEISFFPIGGSNSADASVSLLKGDAAAKEYLTREAYGPDYEDPPISAYSEYYWGLMTDEGCMQELLDKFGLKKEDVEKKAEAGIEVAIDDICVTLGIEQKEFCDDKYRDIRMSDVYFLERMEELLDKSDLTFSEKTATSEPEIMVKLPESISKSLLSENGFKVYTDDKDLINKTYLVIEKEPDNEISFGFTEYGGRNTLDPGLKNGNTEFVKEQIQKIIEEKVKEIEEIQEKNNEDRVI